MSFLNQATATRGAVLAALVVLAAIACRGTTEPNPLRLMLAADTAALAAGGPTTLTYTLTNTGDRAVEFSTFCGVWQVGVVDERGSEKSGSMGFCALSSPSTVRSLEPGASYTETRSWSGEVRVGESGVGTAPLQPGRYQLVGGFGGTEPAIKAAPIPVTVR